MKIRNILIIGASMLMLFASTACDMFGFGNNDLYVSVDGTFGAATCQLYYITSINEGDDAGTGKNIFSEITRTVSYSGPTWRVYSVPAKIQDIYIEYTTAGVVNSSTNGRNTINLFINQWAAIYLKGSDWTTTYSFQGSGEFSIPVL